MNTKLLLAAAVAALSLGGAATASAQPAHSTDPAVTQARVHLYLGFYGRPYYYPYGYYYQPQPHCFYNYWGRYVCRYY
jgi:hypothetical protein